jgi:hypothetical protein
VSGCDISERWLASIVFAPMRDVDRQMKAKGALAFTRLIAACLLSS